MRIVCVACLTAVFCSSNLWASSLSDPYVDCDLSNSHSGLLFVSSSLATAASYKTATSVTYLYNKVGGLSLLDKRFTVEKTNFVPVPNDFPDSEFGHLFVIKLKAGIYEFRGFDYTTFGLHGSSSNLHALKFKIEAGRAVYVGSFDPDIYGSEGSIDISDKHHRDIQAFTKKCPNVDISLIDIRLLPLGTWY